MKEFKFIDVATAKERLQNYITRTEKQLSIVKTVIEALKGREGKELNKRISTSLEKQFPELRISLNRSFSWYELDISEKVGGSFNEIHLNLGYYSELYTVNNAAIVKHNQRYLLDETRLINYRKELDTIEQKCTAYNNALIAFKDAEEALDTVKFTVTDNDTLYVNEWQRHKTKKGR